MKYGENHTASGEPIGADGRTYKDVWEDCQKLWRPFFGEEESQSLRYGRVEINSTGEETFIELGCPYCSLSTSGTHESNCPNYRGRLTN